MTPLLRALVLIAFWVVAAPGVSIAQRATARPKLRPEARVDAILARASALHAGVGAELPVGNYARVEGVVAAGSRVGSQGPAASARADALVRFVLDPFVRLARSPYAAGGLSVRRELGETRGSLVALLGLQLPPRRDYVPAIELGFGGGVRLGLVLRRGQ